MTRTIALAVHIQRDDAVEAAAEFARRLLASGLCVAVRDDALRLLAPRLGPDARLITYTPENPGEVELVVVFGGDGTILRAAEWALPCELPILGVNLGHVGFLAEAEPSQMDDLTARVIERRYAVEERLCLEVELHDRPGGDVIWSSYAINEASLEKSARERMIEVLVEIDGHPLQRWGTDGVLVSTPTGSTAYAFSAQGPVMWPDVKALLVVPLLAHALFARPLVLSQHSVVAITMQQGQATSGVLWCDGRRSTEVLAGQEVVVRRLHSTLKIARIDTSPFVSRLVRKFQLPVQGWRMDGADAMHDPGREIQADKSTLEG